MKVAVIAEIDIETGEYKLTFQNKSEPGGPMDLNVLKIAFLKVATDFGTDKEKTEPLPVARA
jgi:hypothetical protein